MPPVTFTGAGAIARPCVVAPVLATANVTLPALTVVLSALTHMSPSVALTSAFAAAPPCPPCSPCSEPPATFGAPVVCRMPAAPLTMSPNEWVTNG